MLILYSTKNKLRDGIYIVPGDQWPMFLWKDGQYNASEPWNGLLRGQLLIKVGYHRISVSSH